MIIDEELYLEHHGIRGMKWGIRNRSEKRKAKQTKRLQSKIDVTRRVAAGRALKGEKFAQAMGRIPVADLILGKGVQGGAQRLLDRHLRIQEKVINGEAKTRDILARSFGLNYRDVNFGY